MLMRMELSQMKSLSADSYPSRLANATALADRLANISKLDVPVWLDMHEITNLTGLSASSIRRMEQNAEFPPLIRLGPRRRGITLRAYMEWSRQCEHGGRT
jgi:predicted DNA-binding transcriptional regulator AlpA